ncbi:MAG: hypothetical protein Q8L46_00190 [candidate division WWE3 bacterium]|nr:hypothetical protein [candidate division WWE3 bacterium]
MSKHPRNIAESVSILALAFRAGLASNAGTDFTVEPAVVEADLRRGFDLIIRKNGRLLFVDVTSSRRFKGSKISRAVGFAKRGGRWVFILKVDWNSAVFDVVGIGTDRERCFNASFDRLKDGKPAAFVEACSFHGNSCKFAEKLFEFGAQINRELFSSRHKDGRPSQAVEFVMEVPNPPFK